MSSHQVTALLRPRTHRLDPPFHNHLRIGTGPQNEQQGTQQRFASFGDARAGACHRVREILRSNPPRGHPSPPTPSTHTITTTCVGTEHLRAPDPRRRRPRSGRTDLMGCHRRPSTTNSTTRPRNQPAPDIPARTRGGRHPPPIPGPPHRPHLRRRTDPLRHRTPQHQRDSRAPPARSCPRANPVETPPTASPSGSATTNTPATTTPPAQPANPSKPPIHDRIIDTLNQSE